MVDYAALIRPTDCMARLIHIAILDRAEACRRVLVDVTRRANWPCARSVIC
jgi:hypothetical protein